ncbi:Gmad2 immunoglobulin-like domain-containing protein [Nocardioides sp. YIM 152315]|uniref:Gmad2 immunoglobulin-like domain-containing protein n=1 Tax=Nocardioides sp. YIM 152315 TaxID=3031760 RepID=UPI0023DADDAD|nr:Gmad2 immunoglobulin-like domain-containing protein [Nocardioides sp. YIM 152315]MDF1602054.1 Gmad2 immunoglobulin-like domain-containing protein [Nocardioides sp. YIM 152315]
MMEIMSRTRLAALLSLPALALATLSACGDDDGDPTPADATVSEATDEPTTTTDEPSEPASEEPETTTVPAYFVGDTPQGPRLYREFREVGAGDPAVEALKLVTAGDALDPDYSTLYPGDGSFASVDIGEDMITVGLADRSWTVAPDGMSQAEARLATQQMVYTVQGIAQERLPVSITLDGQPADLFGLAGEVSNDPEIDVRALVNVTTPAEGATVSGTFTADGVSSSFEATTPWEIRKGGADGEVVKKGFATAEGWMDKLYPWQSEVDVSGLAPGDYTFVALTDDPSGGEGGGPMVDTKSITVQ